MLPDAMQLERRLLRIQPEAAGEEMVFKFEDDRLWKVLGRCSAAPPSQIGGSGSVLRLHHGSDVGL
ncbi:hypothetical protein XH88_28530 [Bradyrhizobium sp. CCBAU 51627]|nr:hypothetical protein [Bradyrhizobium sp. CCBAU 51627]